MDHLRIDLKELRTILRKSTIASDHKLHQYTRDFDAQLTSMSGKRVPTAVITSPIVHHPHEARDTVNLPKINLPYFYGNIMGWDEFWKLFKGGLDHISRKLYIFFVTSHNFFSLSSVQIIIIPACCLLCVL